MSEYVELIVDHIGQLCVIPAHDGGPQRGRTLGDRTVRRRRAPEEVGVDDPPGQEPLGETTA